MDVIFRAQGRLFCLEFDAEENVKAGGTPPTVAMLSEGLQEQQRLQGQSVGLITSAAAESSLVQYSSGTGTPIRRIPNEGHETPSKVDSLYFVFSVLPRSAGQKNPFPHLP